MTTKYEKLIKRIALSEESRERILYHVTKSVNGNGSHGNVIRFSRIKQYAVIAACLAILAVGAVTLLQPWKKPVQPPILTAPGEILEYASAAELSQAIGFPVEEITTLPFDVQEVSYVNLFDEIAEVIYISGDTSATLRKAQGNEDISGDNNNYANMEEVRVNDISVTLKGNSAAYSLALWQQGGFSYSLYFEPNVDKQELIDSASAIILYRFEDS